MALANIAVLLARAGHRVLAIDWDLEAPGLDRYLGASRFRVSPASVFGAGLIDLLSVASETHEPADWQSYTTEVVIDETASLMLLSCGTQDDRYASRVLDFNWEHFFRDCDGGAIVESWRQQWLEQFDVTLIDSRTGITDSGGVCTIQLPDLLVPVFTTNEQSLHGVVDILRKAQAARQQLAFDRPPFAVLPLPSRFDGRVQYKEGQEWLLRFAEALKEFYVDWLPKEYSPLQMLERTKIPYVAYFSFGEKLPVVDEGTSDPEGVGYAYAVAARLIGSKLAEAEAVIRYGIASPEGAVSDAAASQREIRQDVPFAASSNVLGRTIYLAKPSAELRYAYTRLYDELTLRGFAVVPDRNEEIPHDSAARAAVRRALETADLSVHLLGASSGYRPSEDLPPIVTLQLAEARQRTQESIPTNDNQFRRVIWAPKTLLDEDGACLAGERDPFAVRSAFDVGRESDTVIADDLSDFAQYLIQYLTNSAISRSVAALSGESRLFLLHAVEDVDYAIAIARELARGEINVVFPVFEGNAREVDAMNRAQLIECGSVAVCWANVADVRMRMMLNYVDRLRREDAAIRSCLIVGPPPSPGKRLTMASLAAKDLEFVLDLSSYEVPTLESLELIFAFASGSRESLR